MSMTQSENQSVASLAIPCLAEADLHHKQITVTVPGSKSITNRALLLATLAQGTSVLQGALFSDDSRHFLKCIQDLGFSTLVEEEENRITVTGLGGRLPRESASIYVGSAGTAARFLTAYLGISPGTWHLDASPQMKRRPMAPLLEALEDLGCEILYQEKPGYFPFTLKGHGFGKSRISVDIGDSSQFLSALLIAACLAEPAENTSCTELEVLGTHGMAYIDMTCRMMEQFGVQAKRLDSASAAGQSSTLYRIPAGQSYQALDYRIEPDVSAACYFYAMAALLGISATVCHVNRDSLQGDIRFLDLLVQMGCSLSETPEGLCITGPAEGRLKGIQADLSAFSDQAITLAALAPFADSPTTITGIGHIRHQESDRIHAIVTELTKMGISCEEREDGVTIYPGIPSPCAVDTYEDHRMAMGFSLIGLRVPGIVINDPLCCRKTFENYFEVLEECIELLR